VPARTRTRTTAKTDAADLVRALAFARRQLRASSEQAIVHPFGEAYLNPRLSRAYVLNTLHVDAEVDADQLVAALDDLYGDYGHRRAYVERFDTGRRLADAFRRRHWLVECNVFMVLRRPRDREAEPGLAREVDGATLQAAEAESVREEPYGRDEEVVRQLVAMRVALAAAVPTARFFVGAADGVDAAVTTMYSDGVVAQVEDVATLRDYRRRGLARATVTAAIDAAVEMGHEIVFIVADDDDWPKDLYVRLGFDAVGRTWSFTRPGPEHPGHDAAT
jgi:ribosomal protein S18 acetylase RimI-like enzyme